MRIAFFTDTYLPTINGVVTATEMLAKLLADNGHDLLLVVPQPKEGRIRSPHKRVKLVASPSVSAPMYSDFRIARPQASTIKLLRNFKPDVVHVHTPLTIGFEGVLGAKLMGVPLVHTFHTLFTHPDYLKHLGASSEKVAFLLEKGVWVPLRMFCRNFDVIVAPSEMIRIQLTQRRIDQTLTIPAIVDVDGFNSGCSKSVEKAFPGKKTLIYVGRLSVEKNVNLLLLTLKKLLDKSDDYRLMIVGDGPDRSKLVNMAFDLGISKNILWYGGVDHDEVKKNGIYKSGDVFVSAGRAETFGLTAVEAMASGIPVVAVASEGAKEVVGKYGELIKDGSDDLLVSRMVSAINKVFDPGKTKMYQLLCKKGAERYSPHEVYPQYESLYKSLTKDTV